MTKKPILNTIAELTEAACALVRDYPDFSAEQREEGLARILRYDYEFGPELGGDVLARALTQVVNEYYPQHPSDVPGAMTCRHPRWQEFCERLEGSEGCNFHRDEAGETHWACAGDRGENPEMPELVHVFARGILMKMGLSPAQITASIAYFRGHGGYCDCEVLWNVEHDDERP